MWLIWLWCCCYLSYDAPKLEETKWNLSQKYLWHTHFHGPILESFIKCDYTDVTYLLWVMWCIRHQKALWRLPKKKRREWHKNTQYITLLFTFPSKPYIKRIPFYVIHVHAMSMRRLLSVYHLGYVNSEKKKIAETEKSYTRVIIKIARYRKCNKTLILLYYIFSIKH